MIAFARDWRGSLDRYLTNIDKLTDTAASRLHKQRVVRLCLALSFTCQPQLNNMTDAFPIALVGPSSKERKYDRQLRLWAASGQQALEQSRVLLVNSDGPIDGGNTPIGGVAGVETLKNLVLPGVGGFTIVDPAIVTETDLGVNFFLEESSLGKPRAQETCKYLKELNPDVDGDYKVVVRSS